MGLTKLEKRRRKDWIKKIQDLNGWLFHDGKTTFAWVPPFKGATVGVLGTAICNPADTFKRKIGEYMALENAFMPLGTLVTESTVVAIFNYSGEDIRV